MKVNPLFNWPEGTEDEEYLHILGFDSQWVWADSGDAGIPISDEDEASWVWLKQWQPPCPAGYTEASRLIWEDTAMVLFVKPTTEFAAALLAWSQEWTEENVKDGGNHDHSD